MNTSNCIVFLVHSEEWSCGLIIPSDSLENIGKFHCLVLWPASCVGMVIDNTLFWIGNYAKDFVQESLSFLCLCMHNLSQMVLYLVTWITCGVVIIIHSKNKVVKVTTKGIVKVTTNVCHNAHYFCVVTCSRCTALLPSSQWMSLLSIVADNSSEFFYCDVLISLTTLWHFWFEVLQWWVMSRVHNNSSKNSWLCAVGKYIS